MGCPWLSAQAVESSSLVHALVDQVEKALEGAFDRHPFEGLVLSHLISARYGRDHGLKVGAGSLLEPRFEILGQGFVALEQCFQLLVVGGGALLLLGRQVLLFPSGLLGIWRRFGAVGGFDRSVTLLV